MVPFRRKELTDALGLPADAQTLEIITQARTHRRAAARAGEENSHLYQVVSAALGQGWQKRPGSIAEKFAAEIAALRAGAAKSEGTP